MVSRRFWELGCLWNVGKQSYNSTLVSSPKCRGTLWGRLRRKETARSRPIVLTLRQVTSKRNGSFSLDRVDFEAGYVEKKRLVLARSCWLWGRLRRKETARSRPIVFQLQIYLTSRWLCSRVFSPPASSTVRLSFYGYERVHIFKEDKSLEVLTAGCWCWLLGCDYSWICR
jgi:hypothetical protein